MQQLRDTIYLNIAGFNIQVNFRKTEWVFAKRKLKSEILKYYSIFISDEKPKKIDYNLDFVEIKNIKILLKEEGNFINFFENRKRNRIVSFYQISIVQFQIIFKNILLKVLAKNKGFTLHASASNIDGNAYIFLGSSGVGKSTVIKFITKKYPSLADDSIIIRRENKKFYFYQTPFIEKEWWVKKSLKRYPIGKIFILRKSDSFKFNKIKNKEYILQEIVKQFWAVRECFAKQMQSVLEFVAEFDDFYFLYFAKNRKKLIELLTQVTYNHGVEDNSNHGSIL